MVYLERERERVCYRGCLIFKFIKYLPSIFVRWRKVVDQWPSTWFVVEWCSRGALRKKPVSVAMDGSVVKVALVKSLEIGTCVSGCL